MSFPPKSFSLTVIARVFFHAEIADPRKMTLTPFMVSGTWLLTYYDYHLVEISGTALLCLAPHYYVWYPLTFFNILHDYERMHACMHACNGKPIQFHLATRCHQLERFLS